MQGILVPFILETSAFRIKMAMVETCWKEGVYGPKAGAVGLCKGEHEECVSSFQARNGAHNREKEACAQVHFTRKEP